MRKSESLGWMVGLLAVLTVVTFIITTVTSVMVIKAKKADALVINLAGRQRMLSQKVSKEFLASMNSMMLARMEELTNPVSTGDESDPSLAEAPSAAEDASAKTISYSNSVKVFEATLLALQHGGATWLDLSMERPVMLPATKDAEALRRLGETRNYWDLLIQEMNGIENLLATGQQPTKEQIVAFNDNGLACLTNMNSAVSRLQQLAENRNTLILYVNFAALALALLLSVAMIRYLRPLSQLEHSAALAGFVASGDFTQRIESKGHHEVSRLNGALNTMCEKLSGIMLGIRGEAEQLESTSTVMSGAADDLKVGADQTSATTASIVKEMDELNDCAITISAEASEVNQDTQKVSSTVDVIETELLRVDDAADTLAANTSQLAAAVEQMAASLETVAMKTQETETLTISASRTASNTASLVENLGSSAEKVVAVVNLIKGVAEKTNLLALNASIEAASAGDAGKGFAVVASEIKDLAKRTNVATGQISEQVEEMRHNTDEAVAAIEDIVAVIQQVNEAFEMIAHSMMDQNCVVVQISGNLSDNANTSRNVKAAIHQATKNLAAANSLMSRLAEKTQIMDQLGSQTQNMAQHINEQVSLIQQNMQGNADMALRNRENGQQVSNASRTISRLLEQFNFQQSN